MDTVQISVVAGIIVELFSKASKKADNNLVGKTLNDVVESIGENINPRAAAILNTVADKSKETEVAEQAMENLLSEPDNELAKVALQNHLQNIMKADRTFAEELKKRVENAKIMATKSGIRIEFCETAAEVTRGKSRRARGLSFVDLVLSVLPWPFHKSLPESSSEDES